MKKNGLRDVGFYVLIFVILIATVVLISRSSEQPKPTYSEILDYLTKEQVKGVVLEGDVLTLTLRDNSSVTFELFDTKYFMEQYGELIQQQHTENLITTYDVRKGFVPPWWMMLVPYAVLFVIFILLWYFMFNRSGGADSKAMRFGKARTRLGSEEKKKVTFNDVAGADEEKAELQEIVDFLKNPKKFVEIGARIPKGVLLVGPPGTGKTLIAKAVAGEAGVQFLSISGSDFVELYVGVGASRVRDLFEQAKKAAPSIIFIDEIDAVGRHRGAGMGGGHDEREQTLNQLLVEMDGFGSNEGVIIIAATNRADILDPALLRPGRFDRQVYVGLPDIKGRESILRVHARGKPLDRDVNLGTIAKTTGGFTGADLENLLNEAALLAARRNKRVIAMPEIEEAIIKVVAGPEKKSRVISDEERRLTAYHEAGHAVVMKQLKTHDPVHQISIIPRGAAGGYTLSLPQEDKYFQSKSSMFETIVSFMGGRVAEQLILDDISTGASNDIQRATDIARKMVTKYGMSDKLGPISFSSGSDEVFLGRDFGHARNYSEEIASKIDSEIKSIVDNAYQKCAELITGKLDKLHGVANYLLANETMDADSFNTFFETGVIPERRVPEPPIEPEDKDDLDSPEHPDDPRREREIDIEL